MLFWIIIRVAFRSLWAAKLRSFLAILGIIMGVGAVISMLSIVEGARREMNKMIGSMGTDILMIFPERRERRDSAARLGILDAKSLLEAPSVIRVSPQLSSSVSAKRGNKQTMVQIMGVAPTYLTMRNMETEKGRSFTESEVRQDARVAVLGSKTAEKLFGVANPIDQQVRLNKDLFRVVGVLKAKGAEGFMNSDDLVLAPYTTVQRQMVGWGADLGAIVLQAGSTEELRTAEDEARVILRKRHKLGPATKDDFGIFNQAQMLAFQNRALGIFTIVLGGVGGICLLTGGIGIMNIMLVIVTERTREIGLRKAVGARGRDILFQFLLEAIVMSLLGGILGVVGGWGLGALISALTPLKTVVAFQSVVIAMTFAAAVGIFFGFYPAWRASRMDPIVALHVE